MSTYLLEALIGVKTSSRRGSLLGRTLVGGKEPSLRLEINAMDYEIALLFLIPHLE